MDTIKLLVKEPNKDPYVKEVEHTLENLQEIVGGYIECVPLPGADNIDIYLNEEGKLLHLPGNIWLAGLGGDCVVGTCYMVGLDPKTGENISLTDKQIKTCEKYCKTFALPEGKDLYADYFSLLPEMYAKSEKYLKKSIMEM